MDKKSICVLGLPFGELGVGEQCRGVIEIAETLDCTIKVFDFYSKEDGIKNVNKIYRRLESSNYDAPIKIFSLTQHHLAALLYRYGTEIFENSYNIFHLAWEFSKRPAELESILYLADEIWGISDFVSASYRDNQDRIPIKTFNNYVSVPSTQKFTRSHYGLPFDKFLFLTSLDVNSFPKRKNTFEAIKAFCNVYKNNSNVGLVIKTSNPDLENLDYRNILQEIRGVNNIYLIEDILPRGDLIGLYSCCDVFVSLHRSEGFGLVIAENMLLGKPVICTAYSGNMDFCNENNAILIPYHLIKVLPGEYIIEGDYFWASPYLAEVEKAMIKIYKDKSFYQELSSAAMMSSKIFFDKQKSTNQLNINLREAFEKSY
jgi:glycosyltransferase involved in cell wall biosynthesis